MNKNKRIFIFIFALAAAIISNAVMSYSAIGQPLLVRYGDGTGMLDFLIYYSGERGVSALVSLGKEGAAVYTRLLLIDFIFIIATGIVFTLIIKSLIKGSQLSSKWYPLCWVGLLRSIFDALENVFLLIGVNVLPSNQTLLSVAGLVTLFKWLSMYLMIVIMVIVLVIGTLRKLKNNC